MVVLAVYLLKINYSEVDTFTNIITNYTHQSELVVYADCCPYYGNYASDGFGCRRFAVDSAVVDCDGSATAKLGTVENAAIAANTGNVVKYWRSYRIRFVDGIVGRVLPALPYGVFQTYILLDFIIFFGIYY